MDRGRGDYSCTWDASDDGTSSGAWRGRRLRSSVRTVENTARLFKLVNSHSARYEREMPRHGETVETTERMEREVRQTDRQRERRERETMGLQLKESHIVISKREERPRIVCVS